MNWRDHATPEELERLDELKERRQDASAEMKQIYERCRKRMERKSKSGTDVDQEKLGKTQAQNG